MTWGGGLVGGLLGLAVGVAFVLGHWLLSVGLAITLGIVFFALPFFVVAVDDWFYLRRRRANQARRRAEMLGRF